MSNYQVLVNLTSANFPTDANSSGADIRFTSSSGAELKYWIEIWDYAGKSAKVWVKVPSIPAGASTKIRMYYGNPSATSSSSGDATFEFFDDFEDGIIDPLKWKEFDLNGGSGSAIESDGVLKLLVTTDGIRPPVLPSIKNFQDGILEFKGKVASSDLSVAHLIGKVRYNGHSIEGTIRSIWNQLYIFDNYEMAHVQYILDDNWNFMQMKFSGDQFWLYAKNLGTGFEGETFATITTMDANPIGLSVWKSRTDDHFDDVRVRKYASPEPTVSVGAHAPVCNTSTITGYNFNDTNVNGKRDSIESGLSGWTIRLKGTSSCTNKAIDKVATTNATGYYEFRNVTKGSYLLSEVISPGWIPTTAGIYKVTVPSYPAVIIRNFGNLYYP